MIKRRHARVLMVVTALLVPWEFRAYGSGVGGGWGLTFSYGKYVDSIAGAEFRTIVTEMSL
ncbi:MAG: hypothetical protein SXQ77_00875, partial [Halobacteria archaeon]|nr:hypothetical protein [Halobacteria archaeon]